MKLAFSTLGCPLWNLGRVIREAGAHGFQGIEVRGLEDDLDITKRKEFTRNANLTLQQLQDHDIEIACFSSSVALSNSEAIDRSSSFDEVKRYTQLCVIFGTPFIRIFGGKIGLVSRESALDTAVANLLKMADIVRDTGVKILVETHDDWMLAGHMKSLMEAVSSDAIGLLWDVNHPFMFLGEVPATTWGQTGTWIHHTHWKDSIRNSRAKYGFEPCLMGDGKVPNQEISRVLKEGNYQGYLTLEWEKRWYPGIAEPEVAFPQFVEYMKKFA
jgi:sugar phosphate isomerase/epimerase